MSHPVSRPAGRNMARGPGAPDEDAVTVTRVPAPRAAGSGKHAVQFYLADDEPAAAAGGYLALLCGYPADMPGDGDTADAAREVCAPHSDVIATRSFPPRLDSVRAARHLTVGVLDPGPYSELAKDAAIVATELAANAVLHAGSWFTLTISRSAAAVRITVRDNRPLVPRSDGRIFDIKTGHGLSVVVQLARAWAVERLPDGKAVSAELAVNPG